SWLEGIEVGRLIGEKAQELGAKHGLSAADSVHLASAIHSGAKMLFAWDRNWMNRFPDGQCEGVELCEPFWPDVLPLAAQAQPGPDPALASLQYVPRIPPPVPTMGDS